MSQLVTVITPTWKRPRTILEYAIPSVKAQTYHDVEHLVVIDGRDPVFVKALEEAGYGFDDPKYRITYLGRNWTSFSGDGGMGIVARQVGAWMAAGDYIAYLDDDDTWMPHHLETMVSLLESRNVDFVTGSWRRGDGSRGGSAPPKVGNTGGCGYVFRTEMLKRGPQCWWWLDGYCSDGLIAERWAADGCTWAHNDEPTYTVVSSRQGSPD
jgi:glycosyltransferase involved in cell wall biosynthesis